MLWIITGASGTGKSSIYQSLNKRLLSKFKIYDFDTLGRPYDGSITWYNSHLLNLTQKIQTNLKNRDNTVVCGLIHPESVPQIQTQFPTLVIQIILLDITKEQRAARLQQRNSPQTLIDDLEELAIE